jgi:hypothetical protein
MEDRSKWRAANAVRQYCFRMAVDDAADILVALVDLAVDKALGITLRRIRVDGAGVADVVFLKILAAGDEGWGQRFGYEESLRVLWVADGDVAVCYEGIR